MADVQSLRAELQRVQTMLYDVRAQKDRLQYEIDAIHHKNGTYRIVCHLRNEIQRLTISKLILIQSTALEMDRLRKIIQYLSSNNKGDKNKIDELNNLYNNNQNEYSQMQILNDLLPPPTPTEPPPNFSWKDTFNIDLNEDDIDQHLNDNNNNNNYNNNNHSEQERKKSVLSKLDQEDDIKIPEMNLDLEDGAIKPISLLHRQSSDGDGDNESNDESNDEHSDYVIERVASPEAGQHLDEDSEDEFPENNDNSQIAVAQTKSLFADNYDIMNSDDMTESGRPHFKNMVSDHHIHDDNCDHDHYDNIHPHDASPQLQFAGDGDDLNFEHGVATDAPILPPSTDGDIYGEEDHKFVISIQNVQEQGMNIKQLKAHTLDTVDISSLHKLCQSMYY